MKKYLILISLTLIAVTSFGQTWWDLTFEDTYYLDRIIIDSITNPNNIWQIGHPDKTVFNTAHSSPNVIATDTLITYPINDTSSFSVIHIAEQGWEINYPAIYIDGWYYVNSDTLSDYAFIEFSPDNGDTWLSADSSQNNGCCFVGDQELPTFSGNSFGWKHFHYCLCTYIPVNIGDTILYRFTFISDNIQTNKDGIMFDDLHFEDWIEGIEENQNDDLISILPNPSSDYITVKCINSNEKQTILIYSFTGQQVFKNNNFKKEKIDTRQLDNGIYLLKYSEGKTFSIKKFVVAH